MDVSTTEALIAELLSPPTKPLDGQQKVLAFAYAAGLCAGQVDDLCVESDLTLLQVQGMHTLSHKQTFFVEYFTQDTGRDDAKRLGVAGVDTEAIRRALMDVRRLSSVVPGDGRKQIAERSADWVRAQLVAQLARPAATDAEFQMPYHATVNYEPDKLLRKAEAVRAYRYFFHEALRRTAFEPDRLLAEAKRTLVEVHVGRLNALAAVDVFPGLLALEEQLTQSEPHDEIDTWTTRLRAVAPAIGLIHELEGEPRLLARVAYARRLDAIRQGAPFELDEVGGDEASLFTARALRDLAKAVEAFKPSSELDRLTALGRELQDIAWDASQIRDFFEAVLGEWNMLSRYATTWQKVDDRDGFAGDDKFQVVTTPRRDNLSVDSTRRIVNIPEGTVRPLVGLYPAGVLPLIAHELSHVLQGYADYELGEQIPLAKMKGRRYRILREAAGAYQEKILCRDYFGLERKVNGHYLSAYIAKAEDKNRAEVARVFYDSVVGSQQLTPAEDEAARELAVNRTARLYRHGGHNSQVLDYLEQSIVCDILMQHLQPEQADAFLLGSASFNLEDSTLLHRYGLLGLPARVPLSPAREVMRVFEERFRT